MKILITGASGFIGHHVIQSLLDHELFCVVRRSIDLPKKVKIIKADLNDNLTILKNIEFDCVIHIAGVVKGRKMQDFYDGNVNTTLNLISSIQAKKIIYISSILAGFKSSIYGETKKSAEKIIKKSGIPYIIMRLGGVYGKRDLGFGFVIKMAKKRLGLVLTKNQFNLIHVSDVVKFIRYFLEDTILKNKIYNVSHPVLVDINDVYNVISKILNKKIYKINIPRWFSISLSFINTYLPLINEFFTIYRIYDWLDFKPVEVNNIIQDTGYIPKTDICHGFAEVLK